MKRKIHYAISDNFQKLLQAAKCAEADLEGYRLSHDIAIDSDHPTALTLRELRAAIKTFDPSWTPQ